MLTMALCFYNLVDAFPHVVSLRWKAQPKAGLSVALCGDLSSSHTFSFVPRKNKVKSHIPLERKREGWLLLMSSNDEVFLR